MTATPSLPAVPLDCDLSSYVFDLPESRIAQEPLDRRDASKLMVLSRETGRITHARFADLPDHLPPGALLVANNSKVTPVRLLGQKTTGGAVEFLLLTPLPLLTPREIGENRFEAKAAGLLRASKSPKPGQIIRFDPSLSLTVLSRGEFGHAEVALFFTGDLKTILEHIGHMPLPPYIKRPDRDADKTRYQTVYANDEKTGSAAAPTAGLHFTPDLRRTLADNGFAWAETTLHVGYGTFSPVRCTDIRDHEMHREWIEVPDETAQAVRQAKASGRPVVAVGTTSVRALEGAFKETGEITAYAGWTNIFIRPGSRFNVIDALVTNFHLPGSSLLIMVSALTGRERILNAYKTAVREEYRFFSYGDAMLIR